MQPIPIVIVTKLVMGKKGETTFQQLQLDGTTCFQRCHMLS